MPNADTSVIQKMRNYALHINFWAEQLADSPKSRVRQLFYDLGVAFAEIRNSMKQQDNWNDETANFLKDWRIAQEEKIINGIGPKAIKFE